MIEEHIKFHEEPSTTVVITYPTYSNVAWASKTPEQKKEWQDLINLEYAKAMTLYRPGDLVNLKSNSACVVEIVRFDTNPETVVAYKNLPCVIKGVLRTWQNPNEISYSLPELDWTTLVTVQAPVITLPDGANDEC